MGGLRYLSRRSVRERPGKVSLEIQPGGLAENEVILGIMILVMTYPFTVVNRHLVMLELNTGKKFWCLFGRVVLC